MSKTILITGASTGIGKVTAKFFHEKGWNVIATMRSPEKETELNQLQNVLVTKLDVLDNISIDQAIKAGIHKFSTIDVLVNNAGYGAFGVFETAPLDSIQKQLNTNVLGLMQVTQKILPYFRANKSGIIINISSVGGRMTFPLFSLYHATKFAVEGFSEALSWEMQPIGVKVKIVEPGAIKTDFGGRSLDAFDNKNIEEYKPIVDQITELMKAAAQGIGSEPSVVAEVIYEAATDGTNTLRYSAGEDAKQLMALRNKYPDEGYYTSEEFQAIMKENFNI